MKNILQKIPLLILIILLLIPMGVFAGEVEDLPTGEEISIVEEVKEDETVGSDVEDSEISMMSNAISNESVENSTDSEEDVNGSSDDETINLDESSQDVAEENSDVAKEDSTSETTKESSEVVEENSDVVEENNDEVVEENVDDSSDEVTEETEENSFEFSTITDTHVLPTELIGDNKDYDAAQNSDRKLFTESLGLFEEAIKIIEQNGSKYLFITGDLTKDGEKVAHEKVAEVLQA